MPRTPLERQPGRFLPKARRNDVKRGSVNREPVKLVGKTVFQNEISAQSQYLKIPIPSPP